MTFWRAKFLENVCLDMPRKIDRNVALARFKAAHGDKYDYSMMNYVNSGTKIDIVCPQHGLFKQRPTDHYRGRGCIKCGNKKISRKRRHGKEKFVKRAKSIHGGKYDYSKVEYKNCDTKVLITCPHHGDFMQSPYQHVNAGNGCRSCQYDNLSKIHRGNKEEFLEKAVKIHGDLYDYRDVEYVNRKTNVKIICNIHGTFDQTPNNHIRGAGCPKCSLIKNTDNFRLGKEKFIEKSSKIHENKYNYRFVTYKNNKTKVAIVCPNHGIFRQTPHVHLRNHGCPKCRPYGFSKSALDWLCYEEKKRRISIKHMLNGGEHKIGSFRVDGFHQPSNTVFEFHGDFWHSHHSDNCKKWSYDQNDIHPVKKITHGENYRLTIERENFIKSKGYNLVVMWECEWMELSKRI